MFLVPVLLFMVGSNEALSMSAATNKIRVVVSGAGGQTGQSLFRKLLADDEFDVLGLVRNEESKAKLVESGIVASSIAVVDVTDKQALESIMKKDGTNDDEAAAAATTTTTAFCICTSAKPVPLPDVTDPATGRPIFGFPNGDPELVDWHGQKNQIDACPSGVHVVVCSTMGGTDPNHPLNNLGRTTNEEDGSTVGGNIVKWKRKSEMYLMNDKPDLIYTIVHPGGLINEAGGERQLVIGVDDDMSYGATDSRTVPRDDVAQVMLEAVRNPTVYGGRSFDLRAKPVGEGIITTDFASLLDSYLTDDTKQNCDYSLGETM